MGFEPVEVINEIKNLVKFPSPCGVMRFEHVEGACAAAEVLEFPSPCGVMGFEPAGGQHRRRTVSVSVPLRGNGI